MFCFTPFYEDVEEETTSIHPNKMEIAFVRRTLLCFPSKPCLLTKRRSMRGRSDHCTIKLKTQRWNQICLILK